MRALALVAVAVLAAATFLVPQPSRPVPRAPEAAAAAPYTVCPLAEAARRATVIDFAGGGEGEVTANVFSGGEMHATAEVALSGGGTGSLDVGEVTGLARAPLLVALDDPARVAETILTGDGWAASGCGPGSDDPQVLPGGATAEGNEYVVVVSNPFAGSATVDVLAGSEVGAESDPSLEGVVVPPRSVVSLDLATILPGRQAMSAAAVASQGRVVVGAVHQAGGDISSVSGMDAGLDWYLPVPEFEGLAQSLVVFGPGTGEVPFQLDVYGPDGVVEAAHEDTVPAQGQVVVPVADVMETPGMLRVVAAGPVAAAMTLAGDERRAVLPGAGEAAPIWVLPGAGSLGETRVQVFNPGAVEVAAELLSGDGESVETFDVPATNSAEVTLPAGSSGVSLEADGDVVVHWITAGEEALAGDVARVPTG